MRHFAPLIAILALLAGGQADALQVASGAADRGITDRSTADLTTLQGGGMSLEQAVAQVRRQYPGGKIVSADTRVSGGRETHVIKVLTADGTVKTVRIPGRST